nr:hypothetical protein [Micromonospora sp. DSM 115978]
MIALVAGVITGLALLVAAVTLVVAASWRTAVRVLLELLTAAGLLRLSGGPGWSAIAAAAAIIALRRLLAASLFAPPPPAAGRPAEPPPAAQPSCAGRW